MEKCQEGKTLHFARVLTKNFEEMVTLTAPYEHTNDWINVKKITLIPYESPNARRNAKEI